jgi:hypothetical protein
LVFEYGARRYTLVSRSQRVEPKTQVGKPTEESFKEDSAEDP